MNWINASAELPPFNRRVLIIYYRWDSGPQCVDLCLATRADLGVEPDNVQYGYMWDDQSNTYPLKHVLYWMEVQIPSEVTK